MLIFSRRAFISRIFACFLASYVSNDIVKSTSSSTWVLYSLLRLIIIQWVTGKRYLSTIFSSEIPIARPPKYAAFDTPTNSRTAAKLRITPLFMPIFSTKNIIAAISITAMLPLTVFPSAIKRLAIRAWTTLLVLLFSFTARVRK